MPESTLCTFMVQEGGSENHGLHGSPADVLAATEPKRQKAERDKARRAAAKAAAVSAPLCSCNGVLARLCAYGHRSMFACAPV